MKIVKHVVMLLMLLNLTACSDNKIKEEKGEKKMEQTTMQERPFYMIEAEGTNSGIEIYLNGVSIYHDYSTGSYGGQTFVNDFVKDGLNKIHINLVGRQKENYILDPKTLCKSHL